jgi:hypothetical protein
MLGMHVRVCRPSPAHQLTIWSCWFLPGNALLEKKLNPVPALVPACMEAKNRQHVTPCSGCFVRFSSCSLSRVGISPWQSRQGCIWGGRQPEPFHARQAQPTERCGLKFRAQNKPAVSPNSSTNLRKFTWQAAILSGSSALEAEMHTPPRVPGCLIGSALNTDLRDYPQPRFQSAALPQPPAGQPNPSRAKPW